MISHVRQKSSSSILNSSENSFHIKSKWDFLTSQIRFRTPPLSAILRSQWLSELLTQWRSVSLLTFNLSRPGVPFLRQTDADNDNRSSICRDSTPLAHVQIKLLSRVPMTGHRLQSTPLVKILSCGAFTTSELSSEVIREKFIRTNSMEPNPSKLSLSQISRLLWNPLVPNLSQATWMQSTTPGPISLGSLLKLSYPLRRCLSSGHSSLQVFPTKSLFANLNSPCVPHALSISSSLSLSP
jgi:hypothetical protein